MKKSLPIVFFLVSFVLKSQVVFCPPGAEWHYTFGYGPTSVNETIKYTGKIISGSDTLKILNNKRSYTNCNNISPYNYTTYIKQKGDTVFFNNNRTLGWQILYNFAAQAGDSWHTNYLDAEGTATSTGIMVTAASFTTINGFTLRHLACYRGPIIERIGSESFLFLLNNDPDCHGDFSYGILCYQDSTLGLKQYSNRSCDYANLVGLKEFDEGAILNSFPNPTSGDLTITFQNSYSDAEIKFRMVNLLGEEVRLNSFQKNSEKQFQIDLQKTDKGIYVLQVFKKEKLIATQKIIRN